jgi:hypothetical protein
MEIYSIENDIPVFCKRISQFPIGIKEGFDELAAKFGMQGRAFYGISGMDESCNIIYDCAVTEKEKGEGVKNGYEPFLITKGDYLSVTLTDWMSRTDEIKVKFGELMADPRFDDTCKCVEWYISDTEMMCLVRVK